jgi:hypothetical protein
VARFQIRQTRTKRKLGKLMKEPLPPKDLDVPRVVLGSRPLADISVKDRLVGGEAVAFSWDGAVLRIQVLDALAGVFVDGIPFTGALEVPPGAAVRVGFVRVDWAPDPKSGACTLTVTEGELEKWVEDRAKKADAKNPPYRLTDSGPQEHRWGRSPVLRRLTWGAALAGFGVAAAFPLALDTEIANRGALSPVHLPGASEGAPKDCAACHAPGTPPYSKGCAQCHADFVREDLHPFGMTGAASCEACHAEHTGGAGAVPILEASGPGEQPAMCARCHDLLSPVAGKPRRDRAGDGPPRVLEVDGFSHEDHRRPKSGKPPVACAECHADPAPGKERTPWPGDFARVTYERCLSCHPDLPVPVHGRDEGGKACYACHAPAATPEAITKDLRVVSLPATGSRYRVAPRRHDYAKQDCARCHRREVAAGDARAEAEVRVFRHDHHLPTVDPATGTGLALSEAQCAKCHGTLASADRITAAHLVDLAACAECHDGKAPEPVPPEPGAEARRVVDMAHGVHRLTFARAAQGVTEGFVDRGSLNEGCLSCHLPVAGEARMGMKEDAANCASCHDRHRNLGEGRCARCHMDPQHPGNWVTLKTRDGEVRELHPRFLERGIFDRSLGTLRPVESVAKFEHRSPGHAGADCAACHDPEAVDAAVRIGGKDAPAAPPSVPLPRFDDPSCADCHARTRYHR